MNPLIRKTTAARIKSNSTHRLLSTCCILGILLNAFPASDLIQTLCLCQTDRSDNLSEVKQLSTGAGHALQT